MGVETEEFTTETRRAGALAASVRAGMRDLRQYPGLVSMTVVTVAMGTALALLGPLLAEATEAGEVYVTMHSEVLVLAQPDLEGDLGRLTADLAGIDGVGRVRVAAPSDLEALPPGQLLGFVDGDSLVLEPTGRVPVDGIQQQVRDVPGVESVALGVGIPSQLTIELVQMLMPWLALAFLAAAVLLVAVLSVMTARSRVDEAEAMRLFGGSTVSIWIRMSLVIALPTLSTIAVVTGVLASAAGPISSWVLPAGVTMTGAATTVLATGLRLGVAALLVVSVVSLAAMWRVATK
jgi:hypothetical protein